MERRAKKFGETLVWPKLSFRRADNERDDCTDCSASNGCKAASKVRAEKTAGRNRHEDYVERLAPKYR